MSEPLNVPIATIPKNSREEIRVQLSEFKGTRFADVRIFAEFAAAMGKRSPTAKGVTIPLDRLSAFVRAVTDAEAHARSLGLIGGEA